MHIAAPQPAQLTPAQPGRVNPKRRITDGELGHDVFSGAKAVQHVRAAPLMFTP